MAGLTVVVDALGLGSRVVEVTEEAGLWVGELVTNIVVGAVLTGEVGREAVVATGLAGEDGTDAVVDVFGGEIVGPAAVAVTVGTVFTGELGTEEVVALIGTVVEAVGFLSAGDDG